MKTKIFLFVALALFLGGCAQHSTPEDYGKLPDTSAVRIEAPKPSTPGSLWTERQGGFFYDVKGRAVGDIITVAIYERAQASKEASTKTSRDTEASANLAKLFGLEKNIATLNSAIDPTNLLSTEFKNEFDGSGSTSRKEDLRATLTTQVVEVLPNGNLRIEGGKTVTVNFESQIVKLTGIVRPTDVSSSNIVDSAKVLDARITYAGKGAITDKQKPGWLMRGLDHVWPF